MYWCTCCFCSTSIENAVTVGLVQWCNAGCLAAVVVQGMGACTGARAGVQYSNGKSLICGLGAVLVALQLWLFWVHILLPLHSLVNTVMMEDT